MIPRSTLRILPLALLCCLPVLAQNARPVDPPPASAVSGVPAANPLPDAYSQLIKNAQYDELQKLVLDSIKKLNADTDDQAALLDQAEYRRLIAIAEVIRITTPEQLSELHKARRYSAAFINTLLADTEWMELYLGAGLVPEGTNAGLMAMADIWRAHGRDNDFRDYLSLTSGLGSIWGAGSTGEEVKLAAAMGDTKRNPVWRYEFFRKQQKAGKLHEDFMKLRPWEIRFVAGHSWDDASYEWIAKQVNLPPRRYVDACWFVHYTGTNFFGDSIQGPLFHMPWRDEVCTAENHKLRGAVCGGLSTTGVLAANAHGIPSYAVGQPGHCAYGVRVKRGDWRGGFGGPDGGAGLNIFGDRMPTSYLLMETVFADDATVDKAYRISHHARALEQLGDRDGAIKAWESALAVSPVHKFFRQELHRLYNDKGDMSPQDWYDYAKAALPAYKGNGFAAAEIFAPAESQFMGSVSDQARLDWLKALHESIASTKASWAVKCDDLLDTQVGYLGSDDAKQRFLTDVFTVHLNQGDGVNFGQALEWAVKTFVESGQENIFSQAFAKAAASSSGSMSEGKDLKKLKEAYAKAILAAETAHSISAFQALSQAGTQFIDFKPEEKNFSCEPLPGTLMPPSGLVRLSTSRWDDPLEHRNLLMPCGGKSHTDEETNPSIIVQLPETVKLSGLIVTKRDANQDRMKKMRISTSTDGATWFPFEETNDMPKEWRVENTKDASARWVKIEAINDKPTSLHLRHILIYKK